MTDGSSGTPVASGMLSRPPFTNRLRKSTMPSHESMKTIEPMAAFSRRNSKLAAAQEKEPPASVDGPAELQ